MAGCECRQHRPPLHRGCTRDRSLHTVKTTLLVDGENADTFVSLFWMKETRRDMTNECYKGLYFCRFIASLNAEPRCIDN